MASTTITGLVELAAPPASTDWAVVVDVSDTTQSAFGSTKKILISNLFTSPAIVSPTLSGTIAITGDVAVNTNKVTIAATTGNTTIAGTLAVGAAITVTMVSAQVTLDATTGDPSVVYQSAGTTRAVVQSNASDTIRFLDHSLGVMGTLAAGALSFAGNLAINTNKFTVAGSSGDTLIAGTVTMSTAASQIVPGATSLALRNNANNANNLIILDAGGATFRSTVATAGVTSNAPTGVGVGYATGAGGAVTQATNRSTGVTINKLTGAITTDSTTLSGPGGAIFTVTNSTVAATDTIQLSLKSGATQTPIISVYAVAAGSFQILTYVPTGNETGALVINFAVIKAVAS